MRLEHQLILMARHAIDHLDIMHGFWLIDLSNRAYDEILVEHEGYAFKVEVQYERRPLFCHHCFTIGHNVTTCKWLHQETINDAPNRGKKPVADAIPTGAAPLQKKWVPRRDSTSSTASPLANLPNQETEIPADVADLVHDSIATNSFSFALQNVTDEIPQGRLTIPDIPVLELVTDDEHDDVHSRDVVQTQQFSRNLEIAVAASPQSQAVEHVDMQGSPILNLFASAQVDKHTQLTVAQPLQTVPEGAADNMAAVSNVQEQPVLFSSVSPQQGASLAMKLSDHSIQQVFPSLTLNISAIAASNDHMAEPIQQQSVSTFLKRHVAHVAEQHQVPTCSDLGHDRSSIAPT